MLQQNDRVCEIELDNLPSLVLESLLVKNLGPLVTATLLVLAKARRRKCYGSVTRTAKSLYIGAPTIGTYTGGCLTIRHSTMALSSPRSCPPLGWKIVNVRKVKD